MKPVLVTTKHRGVFGGLVPNNQNMTATEIKLKDARMAIYWGTAKGVLELADTGPTDKSKISLPASEVGLTDVTMIANVTDKAWEGWNR